MSFTVFLSTLYIIRSMNKNKTEKQSRYQILISVHQDEQFLRTCSGPNEIVAIGFLVSKCARIAVRNSGLLSSAFSGTISAVILRSSVVNVGFAFESFDKGCISMLSAIKSSADSSRDDYLRKNFKSGFVGSYGFLSSAFLLRSVRLHPSSALETFAATAAYVRHHESLRSNTEDC